MEVTGAAASAIQGMVPKIKTAVVNSGFSFPRKKIVINIISRFNHSNISVLGFPIAMGILYTQLEQNLVDGSVLYGEINSVGELLPAYATVLVNPKECVVKNLFVPKGSLYEFDPSLDVKVFEVGSLREMVEESGHISSLKRSQCQFQDFFQASKSSGSVAKIDSIQGNYSAKRCLTISVAGRHNVLFLGPSGVGKSILAGCSLSLFSNSSQADIVERARVAAAAGLNVDTAVCVPFRSPHISFSETRMLGSSRSVGEITLAHKGVLFLDEIHLFKNSVLNSLRQVIDNKEFVLNSPNGRVRNPADFLLIGAGNMCMCGLTGSLDKQCKCSGRDINTYRSRISTGLLERFDLLSYIMPASFEQDRKISSNNEASGLEQIRERVTKAEQVQKERLKCIGLDHNSQIPFYSIQETCRMEKSAEQLVSMASSKYRLSTRAVHRLILVARTIADLDYEKDIGVPHVAEAIQYRVKNDKP